MRIKLILMFSFASLFSVAQFSVSKVSDSLVSDSSISHQKFNSAITCQVLYCKSGIASYYGKQFQGRYTSSGEKFDMHLLTAAHKTLPFGTMVVVTNLSNNKSAIVKINDRMPTWNKREIDLSFEAAKKIGLIEAGIAKIQLEICCLN